MDLQSSMYVPITVVGGVANVYKTSLSGGIASGLVASSTDRTVYITTRDVYGNLAFSSGLHPFSADDDLNDFEITIDLDEIVPEGAEIQGYEYTNNGAEYVSAGVFRFTYSTILPGTYYIQVIQKKEAIGDGSNKVITLNRFLLLLSRKRDFQILCQLSKLCSMWKQMKPCKLARLTVRMSSPLPQSVCWERTHCVSGLTFRSMMVLARKLTTICKPALGANPTVKPQTSQNPASVMS